MDILSLIPSTITVDLKHPGTGAPLGIKLELRSMDSDEVKAVERGLRNKAMKSGRNGISAEKVDDNTAAILAATIVSWTFCGDAELGGDKKPACNEANKKKLVSVPPIAKQIDAAIGDEAAFFAA